MKRLQFVGIAIGLFILSLSMVQIVFCESHQSAEHWLSGSKY